MKGSTALLVLIVLVASSLAIKVSVVWTHENGTSTRLPAQDFAKLAEGERSGGDDEHGRSKRNAVTNYQYLWYLGNVYFDIDGRTSNFKLLHGLQQAIQFFHKYTCIRWHRRIPGDGRKNYVIFTMPSAGISLCNSVTGKQDQPQFINIDETCVGSLASVLHEMMHAIGFYHMHTRPDRDQYIDVMTANANPGDRKFFDKLTTNDAQTLGFRYDYLSAMQYNEFKYSSNGQKTMTRKGGSGELGNNVALTQQDVDMVQTLYANCKMACRFNNGDCEHRCFDSKPGEVMCSCFLGFKLDKDGKACYDFDECGEYNGGCEQHCIPQGNLFRCACDDTFTLDDDGFSCKANSLCLTGKLKCQQGCHFNKCFCHAGFTLSSDQISCEDINECAVNNGGCEHQCTNTVGSYTCSCPVGSYVSLDQLTCTSHVCPSLQDPQNSQVVCTDTAMVHGVVCNYSCETGYKLQGEPALTCKIDKWDNLTPVCKKIGRCGFDNGGCQQNCYAQTWDNVICGCDVGWQLQGDGTSCVDVQPPSLTSCPSDIYVTTMPHKSVGSVTWHLPTFTDNDEAKIISGLVMEDIIGGVYDIGAYVINYIIADRTGNQMVCSFKIKVDDVEKPDVFNCPPTQDVTVSIGQTSFKATWDDPSFWDNSEKFSLSTDMPNDRQLQPITQEVHYTATDNSGNSATCTVPVKVTVDDKACPPFPYPPKGGSMTCDQFIFGKTCTPTCDAGRESIVEPTTYICRDGKWIPDPKPHECPRVEIPIEPPTLAFKVQWNFSCRGTIVTAPMVGPFSTAFFNEYRGALCPTKGSQCELSPEVVCEDGKVTLLGVTNEPVTGKYASKYLDMIRPIVSKYQRGAGTFFFMPFGTTLLAPERNDEGLAAVPYVNMKCGSGQITKLEIMKCYSPDP